MAKCLELSQEMFHVCLNAKMKHLSLLSNNIFLYNALHLLINETNISIASQRQKLETFAYDLNVYKHTANSNVNIGTDHL